MGATIKGEKFMSKNESNVNNIYKLDGKVPLPKAIPFGLQHILAMSTIEC